MNWLTHRLKAKNAHGIHSPFLFKFYQDGLKMEVDSKSMERVARLRKKMMLNPDFVHVTDFGTGMREKKQVGALHVEQSSSKELHKILYKITHYLKPKSILELGTGLGLGTVSMFLGYPETFINTVEGCSDTADVAERNFFDQSMRKHISVTRNTFERAIPDFLGQSVDMLVIDDKNIGSSLINDASLLRKTLNNDSVWLINHIHKNKEMEWAWEALVYADWVKVSLDFYDFGLLFFRAEMTKEHYLLRL